MGDTARCGAGTISVCGRKDPDTEVAGFLSHLWICQRYMGLFPCGIYRTGFQPVWEDATGRKRQISFYEAGYFSDFDGGHTAIEEYA